MEPHKQRRAPVPQKKIERQRVKVESRPSKNPCPKEQDNTATQSIDFEAGKIP
jgi:hypothetical protein